jgi:dTDP-4-dehydrorhamnose reductase
MLGQDVTRSAERAGHEPIPVDLAEFDITDETAVRRAFEAERPAAVIHCAAWTDVDGAEAAPAAARAVNATAAGHVARAATAVGATFVHLSTDYVFDGSKPEPYIESDEPRPLSVYGQTKLEGEREVAAAAPGAVIVRSAWLFGTAGKSFPATMLRLGAERDEVTVVTDQIGCPTFTGHLAEALVQLAEGRAPGIHHVAGSGAVSWHDFAVEIFRQAGVECRVLPGTSDALDRPAPRPANSRLVSERADTVTLPAWQEGLSAFLAEDGRKGGPA